MCFPVHKRLARPGQVLCGRISIMWALLTLLGCVPMTAAPPAVPVPTGYSQEFGGALQGGGSIYRGMSEPLTNLQMWYRDGKSTADDQEVGAIMQVGMPAALSAGGYWRGTWSDGDEGLFVGPQIEGGFLWFGLGLPMAIQVAESHWLTTQPTLRLSMFSMAHIPVGYSWQLAEDLRLDLECGVHAFALNYLREFQDMVHGYGSVGLSSQW